MKKSIAFSTLCLSLATAFLPALAQASDTTIAETKVQTETKECKGSGGRGHGWKGGHGHKGGGSGKGSRLQALNLTEEQKTAMDTLKTKFKATVSPKKEELMSHRKALREMLSSDKIDRSAVQQEQDKINALSADMANSMLAFRIDMSENLTPEQRKQMRDLHANWGKKHGGEKRIQKS